MNISLSQMEDCPPVLNENTVANCWLGLCVVIHKKYEGMETAYEIMQSSDTVSENP